MHAHLVRAHVEMAHQIMHTALVQLKACARSEAASEPVVASLEGEDQGWARGAERLRQLEEVQTDMAEQLDAAVQMLRMAANSSLMLLCRCFEWLLGNCGWPQPLPLPTEAGG